MPEITPTPLSKLISIREGGRVARSRGDSELTMIMNRMHMCPTLKGGLRILSQTCKLLRRARLIVPAPDRRALEDQISELRWVLRNARSLAPVIFDDHKQRDSFLRSAGPNPYRSEGAHDHGLCSLLWEIDRAHRRPFNVIRQSELLAHLTVLGYWSGRPEWNEEAGPRPTILESVYRRTLAARHFVMEPYRSDESYRNAFKRLPVVGFPSEIREALLVVRAALNPNAGGLEEDLFRDLAAIAAFLSLQDDPSSIRAFTDDEPLSANTNGGQDQSPKVEAETVKRQYNVECTDQDDIEDDDESETDEKSSGQKDSDDDDEGTGVSYRRERWTKAETDLCMDLGVYPGDILATQHLHLSTRRSGDMRSSQATRNQNLPLATRNLATLELARGLRMLESDVDHSAQALELLTRVKVCLARGLTADKLEVLEVRSDRPETAKVPTLVLSFNGQGPSEWVLPALPLKFAKEHGDYPGCRSVKKDFVMPDFWCIGPLMRRLIERRFPAWKGEPLRPFASSCKRGTRRNFSKVLKRALQRLDSDWGQGLSRRFTFARLARVLAQKIFDQTVGDHVLATYATMHRDPAGEDGRFYATPAVLSVQTAERAAAAAIADKLRSAGYDPGFDFAAQPSDSSGYLGSPMCPTLESIAAFLAKLVDTIVDANAILLVRPDRDAYIMRHNAFVMLTFCVESIGTCHRPAHEGVPDLPDIDQATGLLNIVDKGLARARLGLIADAAYVQRRAYNEYIRDFDFEKQLGVQPAHSLFFIEPDGTVVPVTRSSLAHHDLRFVPNFARHLVKTVFSEWCAAGDKRVSHEAIAALLGHFMAGEEPFGRHSTFRYRAFADSMRQALDHLLGKVKFQPIDISGRQITVHGPSIQRILDSPAA